MSALITFPRKLNVDISPHFNSKEVECHCGTCDPQIIDNRLLNVLEDIREAFGQPVKLTCAYRCPTHNKNVGGVANSKHLYGIAADIDTSYLSIEDRDRLVEICRKVVPGGLGIAHNFIHVDVRDTSTQLSWVYP